MRSQDHANGDGRRQWQPAGLWPRMLAFAVDYLPIAAWLALVAAAGAVANRVTPSVSATLFSTPLLGQATAFVLVTLPVTLYFALLGASPWQASWGKRQLRLRVTTTGAARLSRGHSLARTALKFVPWELAHTCVWRITGTLGAELSATILAGLALACALVAADVVSILVDHRHRALYDRLAGTMVVRMLAAADPAHPHGRLEPPEVR